MSLIGLDSRYHRCIQLLIFLGVEEFKMEDQISTGNNTLIIVEEHGTNLELTVWKRQPTPASPLIRADSVETLLCASNTCLSTELEQTVWKNQPTPDSVNHVPF